MSSNLKISRVLLAMLTSNLGRHSSFSIDPIITIIYPSNGSIFTLSLELQEFVPFDHNIYTCNLFVMDERWLPACTCMSKTNTSWFFKVVKHCFINASLLMINT